MVVFGGISEITKELDDLYSLDIKTGNWSQWFQGTLSLNNSSKPPLRNSTSKLLISPLAKKQTIALTEKTP